MTTWFTSDWHAYDDRYNCLGRGFKNSRDMLTTIISNFIGCVEADDTVIHLGDMCGPQSSDVHFMKDLPGNHILIKGNYDKASDDYYLKYFKAVYSNHLLQLPWSDTGPSQVYLTHEPVNGSKSYFNLVGHVHAAWRVQRNMINVGVDVWHFMPVSLERILQTYSLIHKIYDRNIFAGELDVNEKQI